MLRPNLSRSLFSHSRNKAESWVIKNERTPRHSNHSCVQSSEKGGLTPRDEEHMRTASRGITVWSHLPNIRSVQKRPKMDRHSKARPHHGNHTCAVKNQCAGFRSTVNNKATVAERDVRSLVETLVRLAHWNIFELFSLPRHVVEQHLPATHVMAAWQRQHCWEASPKSCQKMATQTAKYGTKQHERTNMHPHFIRVQRLQPRRGVVHRHDNVKLTFGEPLHESTGAVVTQTQLEQKTRRLDHVDVAMAAPSGGKRHFSSGRHVRRLQEAMCASQCVRHLLLHALTLPKTCEPRGHLEREPLAPLTEK